MKDVAVTDPEFECKFGGNVQILSPPSMTLSIGGKGVYRGPMMVSVTGSSAGGAAGNASGIGMIMPTAMKGQNTEMGYIREGDEGKITVFGISPAPSPTVGTEIVTVKSCKQRVMQSD